MRVTGGPLGRWYARRVDTPLAWLAISVSLAGLGVGILALRPFRWRSSVLALDAVAVLTSFLRAPGIPLCFAAGISITLLAIVLGLNRFPALTLSPVRRLIAFGLCASVASVLFLLAVSDVAAALAAWALMTVALILLVVWIALSPVQLGEATEESQPAPQAFPSPIAKPFPRSPDSFPPGAPRLTYDVTITDAVSPGVPELYLQLLPPVFFSKAKPEAVRCLLDEERARGLAQDGWKVVKVGD